MPTDTYSRLPLDILLHIADHLHRDLETISRFAAANHLLHHCLNPRLRRLKAFKPVAITGIKTTSLANLSQTSGPIHPMLAPVAADYKATTTRSRARINQSLGFLQENKLEDSYYTDLAVVFLYEDLRQELGCRWEGMTGYPMINAVLDDLIDTRIKVFLEWRRMEHEAFFNGDWYNEWLAFPELAYNIDRRVIPYRV